MGRARQLRDIVCSAPRRAAYQNRRRPTGTHIGAGKKCERSAARAPRIFARNRPEFVDFERHSVCWSAPCPIGRRGHAHVVFESTLPDGWSGCGHDERNPVSRRSRTATVVRHGRFARLATLLAFGLLIGSASSVQAATASWNPNTEADLAGYVLHWGMTTHDYTSSIDVGNDHQLDADPDARPVLLRAARLSHLGHLQRLHHRSALHRRQRRHRHGLVDHAVGHHRHDHPGLHLERRADLELVSALGPGCQRRPAQRVVHGGASRLREQRRVRHHPRHHAGGRRGAGGGADLQRRRPAMAPGATCASSPCRRRPRPAR